MSDPSSAAPTNSTGEQIKLIQTPQLSRTAMLKSALESGQIYTDDSSAIAAAGGKIWYVQGDENARKITFKDDLAKICGPARTRTSPRAF